MTVPGSEHIQSMPARQPHLHGAGKRAAVPMCRRLLGSRGPMFPCQCCLRSSSSLLPLSACLCSSRSSRSRGLWLCCRRPSCSRLWAALSLSTLSCSTAGLPRGLQAAPLLSSSRIRGLQLQLTASSRFGPSLSTLLPSQSPQILDPGSLCLTSTSCCRCSICLSIPASPMLCRLPSDGAAGH